MASSAMASPAAAAAPRRDLAMLDGKEGRRMTSSSRISRRSGAVKARRGEARRAWPRRGCRPRKKWPVGRPHMKQEAAKYLARACSIGRSAGCGCAVEVAASGRPSPAEISGGDAAADFPDTSRIAHHGRCRGQFSRAATPVAVISGPATSACDHGHLPAWRNQRSRITVSGRGWPSTAKSASTREARCVSGEAWYSARCRRVRRESKRRVAGASTSGEAKSAAGAEGWSTTWRRGEMR